MAFGYKMKQRGRGSAVVRGFPWNSKLKKWDEPGYNFRVAIVHGYCWLEGHSFPGVSDEEHATAYQNKLQGFDVAFFGDNHSPFDLESPVSGDPTIVNIGSFYRRHSNEVDHEPRAVILYDNGTLENNFFDTSQDVFLEKEEALASAENNEKDFEEVMDVLKNAMSEAGRLSMNTVLKQVMDKAKTKKQVRDIIWEMVDNA
jgi:hypothetical protein